MTRVQIEAFLADPGNVGRDFLGRYVVCTTSGATGIPAILLHDHTALVVYNVLGYARSLPALLLSPDPCGHCCAGVADWRRFSSPEDISWATR